MLPTADADSGSAGKAVAEMRRAGMLADSAARILAAAERGLAALSDAGRAAGTGQTGYRISVVHTAAVRYVQALKDDATCRQRFFQKAGEAFQALGRGEVDEYEVQSNVANSFLRRSEDSQARIRRYAEQVREAAQNLH
jgi:hypothetical protein